MLDPHVQTWHGIVLHLTDYRDTDRIVEVLTLEHGRISVIARGARASKRRFVGALGHFTALRLHVLKSKGMPLLESVDVQQAHRGIAHDWSRFCRASVLCDMARTLLPENASVPDAYHALLFGLAHLAQGSDLAAIHAYPALLRAVGIMPELHENTWRGMPTFQLAQYGTHDGDDPVHRAALDVLQGHVCDDLNVANRAEKYVIDWVEHYLGRTLQSRVTLGV